MKKKLLALIQHPMWLLIKEDSKCLERTPPWGAPSVGEYAKRVARNLDSLDRDPAARVNYDFSGAELEDIRAMFPELAERIKAAAARKQIQFVNGTYSQAHLHTLSLEAAVREFRKGLEVIGEFGQRGVSSYIIQEPGFTEQTPQLLKAFGFKYCSKSCFPVYQKTLDPGTALAPADFFCRWRGLDGTEILTISGLNWHHLDMRRVLPDGTAFSIYAPDLEELHTAENSYVLLDDVLPAEEARLKPKAKLKLIRQYVPWSYLEGTDGDALISLDAACETALVQMETVSALLGTGGGEEADRLWKVWLVCHHHDAYWAGAPELREKCCRWLGQAIAGARTLVKEALGMRAAARRSLVCCSVYPREHRGVIAVEWKGPAPGMFVDGAGLKYPVQPVAEAGQPALLMEYAAKGAGCAALVPKGRAKRPARELLARQFRYTNRHYSAVFNPDGSMAEISAGGAPFPQRPCSALGAMTALTDGAIHNLNENTVETSVERGPVADILRVKAKIGPVPVTRTTFLYHNLPWFESRLDFDFHDTVIGEYTFDVNKLNLIFPLEKGCRLVHGIGGGHASPDEPERAFFPVNWLDVESGGLGLSIINFGTRKHWLKEDTLGISLAWGGLTEHFGNRVIDVSLGTRIGKEMDLRLNGRRSFRYAVYPHRGGWREAGVPDLAMSLLRPPAVLQGCMSPGARKRVNTVRMVGNLVPTSLSRDGGSLKCRVYEPGGSAPAWEVRVNGRKARAVVTDAAGNTIGALKAYGIGNLVIGGTARCLMQRAGMRLLLKP